MYVYINLQVLLDENMIENAERLGHIFRAELNKIPKTKVIAVRGRGLMNAIDVADSKLKSFNF